MKQSSVITSVFSKIAVPELRLKNVYTKPFGDYKERSKKQNILSKYFEDIDWSSDLAKVNGTVKISFTCGDNDNDTVNCISLPVTPSFLFTCTKRRKGTYKVNWSISMS